MAKYSIEDSTLTNIANAIRAKTGNTAALTPAAMDEALNSIPTQAAKTVTPSTTNQTAVASGVFTTGAVTVKGDANLKAENIADGVSIFGVVGSHKGNKSTVTITLTLYTRVEIGYVNEDGTLIIEQKRAGTYTIEALGGALYLANGIADNSSSFVTWEIESGVVLYLALHDDASLSAGAGQ